MLHLIINIIFAFGALFFLIKFFRYKKFAEEKLKTQEERLELEAEQRNELESKYQEKEDESDDLAGDGEEKDKTHTIESLIAEINNLHHKNEQETKLRLEAEKKIALALQKTQNVEQRLEDWKMIQDANLKDAINAMVKIGDNLRQKLLKDYEVENRQVKVQISDIVNKIDHNWQKMINYIQSFGNRNSETKTQNISEETNKSDPKTYQDDLEKMLQNKGLLPRKSYFMNYMIDPKYAKSVPCEAFIILDQENCLIVDFKSLRIFETLNYNKSTIGQEQAYKIFKEKIEQYINYLTNPKYKNNVLSYFIRNRIITQNAQSVFLMFISKMEDAEELKKLDKEYMEILERNNIYLYDLRTIADSIDSINQ